MAFAQAIVEREVKHGAVKRSVFKNVLPHGLKVNRLKMFEQKIEVFPELPLPANRVKVADVWRGFVAHQMVERQEKFAAPKRLPEPERQYWGGVGKDLGE